MKIRSVLCCAGPRKKAPFMLKEATDRATHDKDYLAAFIIEAQSVVDHDGVNEGVRSDYRQAIVRAKVLFRRAGAARPSCCGTENGAGAPRSGGRRRRNEQGWRGREASPHKFK